MAAEVVIRFVSVDPPQGDPPQLHRFILAEASDNSSVELPAHCDQICEMVANTAVCVDAAGIFILWIGIPARTAHLVGLPARAISRLTFAGGEQSLRIVNCGQVQGVLHASQEGSCFTCGISPLAALANGPVICRFVVLHLSVVIDGLTENIRETLIDRT